MSNLYPDNPWRARLSNASEEVQRNIFAHLRPAELSTFIGCADTRKAALSALYQYLSADPVHSMPSFRLFGTKKPSHSDITSQSLTFVRAEPRSTVSDAGTVQLTGSTSIGGTMAKADNTASQRGKALYVGVMHPSKAANKPIARRLRQALEESSAQITMSGTEMLAEQHDEEEVIKAQLIQAALREWEKTGGAGSSTRAAYESAVTAQLETHLRFLSADELEVMEGKVVTGTASEAEQFTIEA